MMDINTFKSQLMTLKDELSQRVEALESDIHHKDEAVEKDFAEQATQAENDDVLNALDDEAKTILIQINNALLRIDNNTYGTCVECGAEINENRLKVVPYSGLCINCAEKELNT